MPKVIPVLTHAGLQGAITDLCTWLGLWWWHDVDPLRNKAGLPDLLIVGSKPRADGRPAELWREVKVPPDVLRPGQRAFGERMTAAGGDWAVWTPADWQSGRIRKQLEAIR